MDAFIYRLTKLLKKTENFLIFNAESMRNGTSKPYFWGVMQRTKFGKRKPSFGFPQRCVVCVVATCDALFPCLLRLSLVIKITNNRISKFPWKKGKVSGYSRFSRAVPELKQNMISKNTRYEMEYRHHQTSLSRVRCSCTLRRGGLSRLSTGNPNAVLANRIIRCIYAVLVYKIIR